MKNKNVVNEGLLTQINISNGLQYHQQDKKKAKQNINTNTELQFEIECPRCYDAMILCSDFNSLYYLCEECNFCLYIQKK